MISMARVQRHSWLVSVADHWALFDFFTNPPPLQCKYHVAGSLKEALDLFPAHTTFAMLQVNRLLSFLYLDVEQLRPIFQQLSDGVRRVITEKSREESDQVYKLLCNLTDVHVYFELLCLDWKYQLDRAWYKGYEFPQNFLQTKYLDEMPDKILTLQHSDPSAAGPGLAHSDLGYGHQ